MGGTLQNTSAHIVYRHLSEGGENVVVFGVVVHGQAKREIFSSRKTRVFSSHMTPPPSLSLSLQHVIESVKLFFLLTRFFPVFLFIHTFFFSGWRDYRGAGRKNFSLYCQCGSTRPNEKWEEISYFSIAIHSVEWWAHLYSSGKLGEK